VDREPDAPGQAFWNARLAELVTKGASGTEVFNAMAVNFFGGFEYVSIPHTDAEYVTDLYQAFFQREPDSGGLAFWLNEIASGKPRGAVLNDFLFSPEFANFMTGVLGSAAGSRAEVEMVMDFYRGLLRRLPDPAGFDYWVARFRAAQCAGTVTAEADGISAQFLGSQEYQNLDAARPPQERNREHVVDLYNAFLRRGGDLPGFQSWVGLLDGGRPREEVRQQFVASAEFQGRVQAVIAQGCLQQ
jgi:hypothetical protein